MFNKTTYELHGITAKQLFAAFAPPVPQWFETPELPRDGEPPVPHVNEFQNKEDQIQLMKYMGGELPMNKLTVDQQEWAERFKKAQDWRNDLYRRKQIQREIEWRRFYAEQMMNL